MIRNALLNDLVSEERVLVHLLANIPIFSHFGSFLLILERAFNGKNKVARVPYVPASLKDDIENYRRSL